MNDDERVDEGDKNTEDVCESACEDEGAAVHWVADVSGRRRVKAPRHGLIA
jgi:hypothetical protein